MTKRLSITFISLSLLVAALFLIITVLPSVTSSSTHIQILHQSPTTDLATENQLKATQFLEKNKKQPGVQALASGLQYKVLNPGSGQKSESINNVTLEFKAYRQNGEMFESSNGVEVKPINVFIPGLKEALNLMNPGAEWTLFIPPQLGYKEKGYQSLGPNELIIMRVHLIKAA